MEKKWFLVKFCILISENMSRFEKATRPYDIQPTLWMSIGLTILVGSIIGKLISQSEIITQFLR